MNKKKKNKEIFEEVKKAWNWIWNSDSILSWIVALVIIFIGVKYVFFPVLSLIMGTSLPLAGVESSSMDHSPTKYCVVYSASGACYQWSSDYKLCQDYYDKKERINFDEYWDVCGSWYEEKSISKEAFQDFKLKNGFKKGDIVLIWGRFKPKIGDIIIFQPNSEVSRPIIHRIVGFKGDYIMTKGDHNEDFLTPVTSKQGIDETRISQEQIVGKAIFKIPYLGWFKIWVTELFSKIVS